MWGIKNKWIRILGTHHLINPEFKNDQPFSVDKMNSYLLGKNIYLSIMNCSTKQLDNKHSFTDIDFNHEIFNTPAGNAYKNLIKNLVQPDPKNRISISEAQDQLQFIQNHINDPTLLSTWAECYHLLHMMNDNKTDDDVTMPAFIREMTDKIQHSQNDLAQLQAIRQELDEKFEPLNALKACNDMLAFIKSNMPVDDPVTTRVIKYMSTRLTNCNNNLELIKGIKKELEEMYSDQIELKKNIVNEYNDIAKQLDIYPKKIEYTDWTLAKTEEMLKTIKVKYAKALINAFEQILNEMASAKNDLDKQQFLENKHNEIVNAGTDISQLKPLVLKLQKEYINQTLAEVAEIIAKFQKQLISPELLILIADKLERIEFEINNYVTNNKDDNPEPLPEPLKEQFKQFKQKYEDLQSTEGSMQINFSY